MGKNGFLSTDLDRREGGEIFNSSILSEMSHKPESHQLTELFADRHEPQVTVIKRSLSIKGVHVQKLIHIVKVILLCSVVHEWNVSLSVSSIVAVCSVKSHLSDGREATWTKEWTSVRNKVVKNCPALKFW